MVLHPDAVAEYGSAGEGTRRVDGEYGDFIPSSACGGNQLVGESALAGAGGAGEADDVCTSSCGEQHAQSCPGRVGMVLDVGYQAGQGATVTLQHRRRQHLWILGTRHRGEATRG